MTDVSLTEGYIGSEWLQMLGIEMLKFFTDKLSILIFIFLGFFSNWKIIKPNVHNIVYRWNNYWWWRTSVPSVKTQVYKKSRATARRTCYSEYLPTLKTKFSMTNAPFGHAFDALLIIPMMSPIVYEQRDSDSM